MKWSYKTLSEKVFLTQVKSFDINGLSDDFLRCHKMSYHLRERMLDENPPERVALSQERE
jgi:hypothetical protein